MVWQSKASGSPVRTSFRQQFPFPQVLRHVNGALKLLTRLREPAHFHQQSYAHTGKQTVAIQSSGASKLSGRSEYAVQKRSGQVITAERRVGLAILGSKLLRGRNLRGTAALGRQPEPG